MREQLAISSLSGMSPQPVGPEDRAMPAGRVTERHRGGSIRRDRRQRDPHRAYRTVPNLAPLVERLGERQDFRAAKVSQPACRSMADGLDEVVSEVGRIHRLQRHVR